MPSGPAQQPAAPAPYWGALPPSKAAAASRQRRLSMSQQQPKEQLRNIREGLQSPANGPSVAIAPAPSPPPGVSTAPANHWRRISVQTAWTDAPAESATPSLFASPTRSSFSPAGLTPRPASFRPHAPVHLAAHATHAGHAGDAGHAGHAGHARHASADTAASRHGQAVPSHWRRSSGGSTSTTGTATTTTTTAQPTTYAGGGAPLSSSSTTNTTTNTAAATDSGTTIHIHKANNSSGEDVPAPPAAPDVPRTARAPPVSFRSPLGSPYVSPYTSPYTSPGPFGNGPSRPPNHHHNHHGYVSPMEPRTPDDFYKEAAAVSARHQVRERDEARPAHHMPTHLVHLRDAIEGSVQGSTGTHSRSSSLSVTTGRPNKYTDDRSPLQKLEQRLDAMTKEEKRAKAAAAEQRAREKAALQADRSAAVETEFQQQQQERRERERERDKREKEKMERDLERAKEQPEKEREKERDNKERDKKERDKERGGGRRPRISMAPQPQSATLVTPELLVPQRGSPREEQDRGVALDQVPVPRSAEERRQRRREERAGDRARVEPRYEPRAQDRTEPTVASKASPKASPKVEPKMEPEVIHPRTEPQPDVGYESWPEPKPEHQREKPFEKREQQPVVVDRVDPRDDPNLGVPVRNLSFRERAAGSRRRDLPVAPASISVDAYAHARDESPPGASPSFAPAGHNQQRPAVPVRTSSNKLRKDPPPGYFDRIASQKGTSSSPGQNREGIQQQQQQHHRHQHQQQAPAPAPPFAPVPPSAAAPNTRSIPTPAWANAPQPPFLAQQETTSAARPQTAGRPGVVASPADALAQSFRRRATDPTASGAMPARSNSTRNVTPQSDYLGIMDNASDRPTHHTRAVFGGQPPQMHALTRAQTQPQSRGAMPVAPQANMSHKARPSSDDHVYDNDELEGDDKDRRLSRLVHDKRQLHPWDTVYRAPKYLDEWRTATVGSLSGVLLDLATEPSNGGGIGSDRRWWEGNNAKNNARAAGQQRRRSNSISERAWKAEAFDGEYDDSIVPTRFKPALYLECGPLLRYCGIRYEKTTGTNNESDRQIWRGTVMVVTRDKDSSYEIAPTLRLFLQPMELLPPPPAEISGQEDLRPEYVDPIAGHPKLGRRGETLYVRPVEHLDERRDLSRDETDDGLFERTRTAPDALAEGETELRGSYAGRRKRTVVDGETASPSRYTDAKGFRLHAERGLTFWRFNVEVELRGHQQRVAYRINRGPAMGFWVPARGQSMNVMFHSSNGTRDDRDGDDDHDLCGPDPMWRDVLNVHQTQPFHVMVGGGDQIDGDDVAERCRLFGEWLRMRDDDARLGCPFTPELQDELEEFYLGRYCARFSQGLFGLAASQIPMVNVWDDGDIFGGFGSYPDGEMAAPVFAGLGAVAFRYYMLFQHQSTPAEPEAAEPSWVAGARPGPYIQERSRSVFVPLGARMALLAVDCRTERDELDIVRAETWKKIMDRCYAELVRGQARHLLVVLGTPVAYPRVPWLDSAMAAPSRLASPLRALGRTGLLGRTLHRVLGGDALLDDMMDHWTAKHHKVERSFVVRDLRDLAALKSVRVTILSGDGRMAAVGQFCSDPEKHIPKHEDFRYIPNVISSSMAAAPPPRALADVLDKRSNRVRRFDPATVEAMMPLFSVGVDGIARANKRLLPNRNWCSIREWVPGHTPPQSADGSRAPSPERPGLLRRLSSRGRSSSFKRPAHQHRRSETNVLDGVSRPPPSSGGGFFRSLSRRRSVGGGSNTNPTANPTTKVSRSSSVGSRVGSLFGSRRRRKEGRNDEGRNDEGAWAADGVDVDVDDVYDPLDPRRPRDREYETGDEGQFVARPLSSRPTTTHNSDNYYPPTFWRPAATPDGRPASPSMAVNLHGGLDIMLNAEVCPAEPAGITAPYRLLVPRLFFRYEDSVEYAAVAEAEREGMMVYAVERGEDIAEEEEEEEDMTEEEEDGEEDGERGALDEARGLEYIRRQQQGLQDQNGDEGVVARKGPSRFFGSLRRKQVIA